CNLLTNSFKFVDNGGEITITIDLVRYIDNKQFVKIEIEDNGLGISEQNLPHIFEQFQHFDETGSGIAGSGVGLAFTKELVSLHHGVILVESTQANKSQKGLTRFTILIPAGFEHLRKEEILIGTKKEEDINSYFDYGMSPDHKV